MLHNVGLFISHAVHHQHSYYLIRNSDQLAGFIDAEIVVRVGTGFDYSLEQYTTDDRIGSLEVALGRNVSVAVISDDSQLQVCAP